MKLVDAARSAKAWLKTHPKGRSYLIGGAVVVVVIAAVRLIAV